jgi:hypothetical protein
MLLGWGILDWRDRRSGRLHRREGSIGTGLNRALVSIWPNVVPGQSLSLDNPSPNAWFNTKAVVLQAPGTFGNMGRNVMTAPGVFSVDSATKEEFLLYRAGFLQFRFEAFNFFNHPISPTPTPM